MTFCNFPFQNTLRHQDQRWEKFSGPSNVSGSVVPRNCFFSVLLSQRASDPQCPGILVSRDLDGASRILQSKPIKTTTQTFLKPKRKSLLPDGNCMQTCPNHVSLSLYSPFSYMQKTKQDKTTTAHPGCYTSVSKKRNYRAPPPQKKNQNQYKTKQQPPNKPSLVHLGTFLELQTISLMD